MHVTRKHFADLGFELMVGSAGGADYLFFAQHPETGAKVGIKPLVLPHDNALIVAARIRMTPPGLIAGPSLDAKFSASQDWPKSYPGVEWSAHNNTRKSTVYACALRCLNHTFAPQCLEDINFFDKITTSLTDKIPRHDWAMDPTVLEKFLRESYAEYAEQYGAQDGVDPLSKNSLRHFVTDVLPLSEIYSKLEQEDDAYSSEPGEDGGE